MTQLLIPAKASTAFEKDKSIDIGTISSISFTGYNSLVFKFLNGSAAIWSFSSIEDRTEYFSTLNEKITFDNLKHPDVAPKQQLEDKPCNTPVKSIPQSKREPIKIIKCETSGIPGLSLSMDE